MYLKGSGAQRRREIEEIFNAALHAVDPFGVVLGYLPHVTRVAREYSRHLIIAFGKAALPMTRGLIAEPDLADAPGIALTTRGSAEALRRLGGVEVLEGGHPIPDAEGLEATKRIISAAKRADSKTAVFCLISGGGSSLLVAPQEGISLRDKQEITSLLLKAGADINELNTVRKHLSAVKGGRLAQYAFPARVVSLILSDVIGDPFNVIASGPTAPDDSTFGDALAVLQRYQLYATAPRPVIRVLEEGAAGRIPETPKRDDPVFASVENVIVGSNRIALEGARRKAEELGLKARVGSSEVTGEARDTGEDLARKAVALQRSFGGSASALCLISGGETTVTVRGNGRGGRNTEMALAFARAVQGVRGITFLSAGTDGRDGPTDAAGAVVDGMTWQTALEKGLDPAARLDDNDSYSLLKETGSLLITGPTNTNVMDIQITIIEPPG